MSKRNGMSEEVKLFNGKIFVLPKNYRSGKSQRTEAFFGSLFPKSLIASL